MSSIELLKPWRIIASLIPVLYAGLLIWQLQNSRTMILIAVVALFLIFTVISNLGYSPLVLMPAFAGIFLLLACLLALYLGLPIYDATAPHRSPLEVWMAVPISLVYIAWGVWLARRYLYSI